MTNSKIVSILHKMGRASTYDEAQVLTKAARVVEHHARITQILEDLVRAYNRPIPDYEDGFAVEGEIIALEQIARHEILRAKSLYV